MAYEKKWTDDYYKTHEKIDFAAERKKKLNKNSFMKSTVSKEGLDKMGNYKEAPGGGTPAKGGGRGAMGKNFVVADSPEDPIAKAAKEAGKDVRYNQPRDKDGRFGFNSDNLKGLHDEARGDKSKPQTAEHLKANEDITEGQVLKDNDKYVISTINMTREEMKEAMKIYDEFGSSTFTGMDNDSFIDKKGRRSKAEKESEDGIVSGKKVDIEKLRESTKKAFYEAKERIKQKKEKLSSRAFRKKESASTTAPKPEKKTPGGVGKVGAAASAKSEEDQASKVFKEDLRTPKKETKERKISEEKANKVLEYTRSLGEDYSDIDINDIYEMFEDGTLTDEDLAEIGITD